MSISTKSSQSSTFKVNDLVTVVSQPENQFATILHHVGFIESIDGQTASFISLGEDGRAIGSGSVPLNCLSLCNDNQDLAARKQRYNAILLDCEKKLLTWNEYYKQKKYAALCKACKETGVTLDVAIKIFGICEEYLDELSP